MQTLLFFYGLAFLVMGILIFAMPKKNDLLGIAEDLRLVGLFGLLHGMTEWMDLLILRGYPFNVEVLTVFGALLLPLSFVPLIQFGVRILFREMQSFRFLRYLWMIPLAGWAVACFLTPDFLIPDIVARYFICLPGALLTAIGLFQIFLKADKKKLPVVVSAGMVSGAVFFIFYGMLSGLVVPKAGFLLASFINVPFFLETTGIPVQFFRMFCAIFLAFSFFAVIGVYSFHEEGKRVVRRGGIKRKIILWLAAMIFSIIFIMSTIGFLLVFRMREESVRESLRRDAGLIAASISSTMNEQMKELRVLFKGPEWKSLLSDRNASYESRSSQERKDHFREMDRKWADPSAGGLEKYLNPSASARLKIFVDTEKRLTEVFLTDRYGGLVAASRKTTDFFQAEEAWWKDTFDGGKGRETVQDVAWDDSSKTLSMDMAIPIKSEQGEVLGIAKQVIDVRTLLAPLQGYHVGKTGQAILVNDRGDIIFHPKFKPLTTKYYDQKMLRELFRGDRPRNVLLGSQRQNAEMLITCMKVDSPILETNGVHWYVFAEQNKREVFEPVWQIVSVLGAMGGGLFLIFLWIGDILGGRLVRPIRELTQAAGEVQKGNWDHPVVVHSRDEIQELAESFHYMIEHLWRRQTEILSAKEAIEALSHGLEVKVAERTKDLSESQRAMVNMLEDLSTTNRKLEKYTEELTKAKEQLETQARGLQNANEGIKALNQELEKKNLDLAKLSRLKDDFVSVVAHELRNPLGVVREAAALILDGFMGPVSEKQKQYLEIIQRTGDRLIHITTDLLDLAKIEAGKIVVNYESMDFLSLARQACEGIALRANKKGLAVSQDFPDGRLEIFGDFDKLSQVMVNLLSNAFKFTEKGSITVEVKDLGEEIRCAVRDTGPGISRENLSRLFSKFEQFGEPVMPDEKGSGLGLVISKSIVGAHGGRIWAESELDKGSSFIFTIPKDRRREKSGTIPSSGKEQN